MKIIAAVTIIGKNRESFEPGSELDLPKPEAESLIERGLAILPEPDTAKVKKPDPSGDSSEGDGNPGGQDEDPAA